MSRVGFGLVAALLSAAPAVGQTPPVSTGWERPTDADLAGADWQSRAGKRHRYVRAEADFNGDGKPDGAEILVNSKAQTYALFAFITDASAPIKLDDGKLDELSRMGIRVGKPGRRQTACGKGYGCQKGDVPFIDLKYATIQYFLFESATSEFHWADGKFERFWTSD